MFKMLYKRFLNSLSPSEIQCYTYNGEYLLHWAVAQGEKFEGNEHFKKLLEHCHKEVDKGDDRIVEYFVSVGIVRPLPEHHAPDYYTIYPYLIENVLC